MINNILFSIAPALSAIFKLGFEPTEECFLIFTDEQYEYLREEGVDVTEAWYMVLPKDHKYFTGDEFVASEKEKKALLEAAKVVESYCKKCNKEFATYQDKLKLVASLLPPVFTENSNFKQSHLKPV